MVIEVGVVVGYLIAWALRKAKRVGGRLDEQVDEVLDAGLDKLHEAVAAKLGTDPALGDLQEETSTGQVSELTRQRVELSLLAAAGKDEDFAQAVTALVDQVRQAEQAARAAGRAGAIGPDAVAVAGDVSIHAETGGAAAWRMKNVQAGYTAPQDAGRAGPASGLGDPQQPDRPSD